MAITLEAVLCGCINAPAPSPLPGPDITPDIEQRDALPVAEVAESLAHRIDAGATKGFRHSDELFKTVEKLVDAGELSKADGERLIDACDGIRAKRRDLTADDAAALRGVK